MSSQTPDGVSLRALAFGTYDTGTHPRVRVLIEGLRSHGVEVRELNEPLGLSTAQRVEILKQPWRVPGAVRVLAVRWLRLVRQARSGRRGPKPDFVLVGYLGHFDVVLARVLFPRTLIVLDHLVFASGTAVDRGAGTAGRATLLRLVDLMAIKVANIIVVDTEEHRAMVPARSRSRVVVVPVGASTDWLGVGAGRTTLPRTEGDPLRVIFFGLFTPLQGAPVIAAALRLLHERGVSFETTMVGAGQDYALVRDQLDSVPKVIWREWVEPHRLPALVAEHDVCLGIFGTTPKALDVVPNKIYQGAAAGAAIVTSGTSPQRRAFDGAALFVPPADPQSLADALERLAGDSRLVRELELAGRARVVRDFAPEAVVLPLLGALRQASQLGDPR